jgi:hypothetical protein
MTDVRGTAPAVAVGVRVAGVGPGNTACPRLETAGRVEGKALALARRVRAPTDTPEVAGVKRRCYDAGGSQLMEISTKVLPDGSFRGSQNEMVRGDER